MHKLCQQVFLTISLLNLDMQLGGSSYILWLQKSFVEPRVDATEMIILGVGVTITLAWVALGFFAVSSTTSRAHHHKFCSSQIQQEQRMLVYPFFALSLFTPSLNVANLIRVSTS